MEEEEEEIKVKKVLARLLTLMILSAEVDPGGVTSDLCVCVCVHTAAAVATACVCVCVVNCVFSHTGVC